MGTVGPTSSENAMPVDLEGFRAAMREAGVEGAVDEILNVFIADAPERFAALESAFDAGDATEVAKAAHAFKSAAGSIHAQPLADALNETEAAAKVGDADRALGYRNKLRDAYGATMQYLENIDGGP